MTPPPGGTHNLVADTVHRFLATSLPPEVGIFQTLGIGIPSVASIYIPDFSVVPRNRLFSSPADGAYRDARRVPFGRILRLEAPLDVEIDSSSFPTGR